MTKTYSNSLKDVIMEFNKLPSDNYRHDLVLVKIFEWMRFTERRIEELNKKVGGDNK